MFYIGQVNDTLSLAYEDENGTLLWGGVLPRGKADLVDLALFIDDVLERMSLDENHEAA